ncbi:capsule assembly Wzi family protein [Thalassotalea litorea]|uniref:Capsule assembly Wzi family protein n=1 Tax=Thalassotalea litorea TaxID=2020715 RepID=A0A5R9IKV9_9GAMM|nr:capsule assembly Wzi family protein [Thalassotalea litorea]TLU65103.1 capsule assembly Wzi family protein [Thalassotalea litorea]
MKRSFKAISAVFAVFSLSICHFASAFDGEFRAPWVDTDDLGLRTGIQRLNDSGIINIPVTTYPLLWQDIDRAMESINESDITGADRLAFEYINAKKKLAKEQVGYVQIFTQSDNRRFSSFGESFRDTSFIKSSLNWSNSYVAVNVSPSVHFEDDGDILHLDDSYISGFLGNWVFTLGKQNKWFGPGWDTSLAPTNNARPIPTVSLTRKTSIPLKVPFTESYGIPWSLTTGIGLLEEDRHIPDALIWTFRFNFKLTQSFELGVTRLIQWGGEGRPQDIHTFWEALKGNDNCGAIGPSKDECLNGKEPGNQMAGYDLRYNLHSTFSIPFSLYMQMIAEDGDSKGGLSIFGEEQYQYGVDLALTFDERPLNLFLEYTDTFADCTDGSNVGDGSGIGFGDCYYEHSTYQTGMRYKRRTIGSIYENDAKTWVLGGVWTPDNKSNLSVKLKKLKLNSDNSDRYPDNLNLGNTLTKNKQDLWIFSMSYHSRWRHFEYQFGGNFNRLEEVVANEKQDALGIQFYFSGKYLF